MSSSTQTPAEMHCDLPTATASQDRLPHMAMNAPTPTPAPETRPHPLPSTPGSTNTMAHLIESHQQHLDSQVPASQVPLDTFPWHRLPREIRNKIHSLLREHTSFEQRHKRRGIPPYRGTPRVRPLQFSPGPTTAMLLVNKEFRSHYQREVDFHADTVEYKWHPGNRLDMKSFDVPQRLDHIHTLVLTERAVDRWINMSSQGRRDIEMLLSMLPQLKHVVFHLRFKVPGRNRVTSPVTVPQGIGALAAARIPGEHASLTIQTEVSIRDQRYSPYQLPGWESGWWWAGMNRAANKNWIEYRGDVTSNQDAKAWYGLDLEVVSCGEFTEEDFQAIKRRAAREQEYALKRRARILAEKAHS